MCVTLRRPNAIVYTSYELSGKGRSSALPVIHSKPLTQPWSMALSLPTSSMAGVRSQIVIFVFSWSRGLVASIFLLIRKAMSPVPPATSRNF